MILKNTKYFQNWCPICVPFLQPKKNTRPSATVEKRATSRYDVTQHTNVFDEK